MVTIVPTAVTHGKAGMFKLNKRISMTLKHAHETRTRTRTSVRKRLSSDKDFTGTSVLYIYLFPLYEFNVLQHTVIDTFYTIPFTLCKNQVQRLLELELLDKTYLDEQFKIFPWTTELKTGRLLLQLEGMVKVLGTGRQKVLKKLHIPCLSAFLKGSCKT